MFTIGLIYCDQESLWPLNVIEDDCYFLGVRTPFLTMKDNGAIGWLEMSSTLNENSDLIFEKTEKAVE